MEGLHLNKEVFNSQEEEGSLGSSDTGFEVAKLAKAGGRRAGGVSGQEMKWGRLTRVCLGGGRAVDCITIQMDRGQEEPGTECSGPCTTYQLSQPSFQCRQSHISP